ncbi:MAG: hypothetical protein ACYTEQ_18905 [Planctomycetota bacterium]|jgi:hypothetical protein
MAILPGKKSLVLFGVLACLVFLAGCDYRSLFRKSVPEEVDRFAREYIDALRRSDLAQAEKLLDPQFADPNLRSRLEGIVELLSRQEPVSVECVGWRVLETPEKKRSNLTYQLTYKEAWLLVTVVVDEISGKLQVYGVNVKPLAKSLEEIHAFKLAGKSFAHYVVLLSAIVIPVFVIWTVVLCVRTKVDRKWLWIIFILIGIGKLSLNWTTGRIDIHPVSFLIPGATVFRGGPYSAWVVSISFPLWAFLFLWKRRKISKARPPTVSGTSGTDTEGPGT